MYPLETINDFITQSLLSLHQETASTADFIVLQNGKILPGDLLIRDLPGKEDISLTLHILKKSLVRDTPPELKVQLATSVGELKGILYYGKLV